jgi:small subunit ribosomal protein S8e
MGMAISQRRAKRKASGGRYRRTSKKLKNRGSLPVLTGISKLRKKLVRVRAGFIKERLLSVDMANVYDPKAKKYFKVKIETVVESPSNRNFVRRNIMTKGTVIKTEKGNAKITSRPGQEGTVNAVLV